MDKYGVAEISGLTAEDAEELNGLLPADFSAEQMVLHPLGAGYEPIAVTYVVAVASAVTASGVLKLAGVLFETLQEWARERDPGKGRGISVNGYQVSTLNAEQLRRALMERAHRVERKHAAQSVDVGREDSPDGVSHAAILEQGLLENKHAMAVLEEQFAAMEHKLDRVTGLLGHALGGTMDKARPREG